MDAVRRKLVVPVLALALGPALMLAPGGAVASSAASPKSSAGPLAPYAKLRSFRCVRALDPTGRAIDVTAVMRPVAGTRRMAMRFVLMRRAHRGAPPAALSGPDLGMWITPGDKNLGQQPGDRWIVHHPVVDLSGPAVYRFVIEYRWIGRGGRQLAFAKRLSHRCYEPELRPNLSVVALNVMPLQSGEDRYVAIVRNDGETAAGPFNVSLSIGSSGSSTTLPEQPVSGGLAPHATVRVAFHGPACSRGESLVAVADPEQTIDDANRIDNTYAVSCP